MLNSATNDQTSPLNCRELSVQLCLSPSTGVISAHEFTPGRSAGRHGRYLDDGNSRADVNQEIREDVRVCVLETKLRVGMLRVHESLMRDILQHEVTALDQARHLVLLVHSAK